MRIETAYPGGGARVGVALVLDVVLVYARAGIGWAKPMAMRGKKQAVDDGAMRALLKRYACPIPYYEVRTRFMGNIATPDMHASPMKEIQRLWNDDLPEFEDQREAEAFFSALLQGMWNGLSAHQKRMILQARAGEDRTGEL